MWPIVLPFTPTGLLHTLHCHDSMHVWQHVQNNPRNAVQARQSLLPIKVSRYPAIVLMLHWLIVFLTIQFTAAYASIQGETTLLLQAVVAN